MRTIAVEEHFVASGFAEKGAGDDPGEGDTSETSLTNRLGNLGEGRVAAMDDGGIDVQVISETQLHGVELTTEEWTTLAEAANDELADAVAAHPNRFAGFATLPMATPEKAADELERTVSGHGFVGAMINGTTDGQFLDHPRFVPVLERAAELDVPLYIHPGFPPETVEKQYYEGFGPEVDFSLATTSWGWHAEAGLHALRLIASGVFDRLPDLKIVLGHMGEMIPFMLDRIDEWLSPLTTELEHDVPHYFREHFWLTTSGMFSRIPFRAALAAVGADNVMFAVDYPYSSNEQGRRFIENVDASPTDLEKITHRNAERLFGLSED
ncbi:hypothetical protein A4G99_04325 [Haladaptatus sp. R4]|uniref:amidohydrolase family protein n=1 Tax=Haladaptatus sp. R4 TaxID=1679489 RepID=UPI0007B4BF94|nr:amidohydrolase family protein [Haladaptatus sp. R4]KZN25684.1 hypothetical protein A4G99_04325 [Haladaptatus sp. R4]